MPLNIIVVNGNEYKIPDSWMPPLWEYLKLVEAKLKVFEHMQPVEDKK